MTIGEDTTRIVSALTQQGSALSGNWTIGNQATILNEANVRIAFTPAIFISSWDRPRREDQCDFVS